MHKSKVGIIIGVVISLLVVAIAVVCILIIIAVCFLKVKGCKDVFKKLYLCNSGHTEQSNIKLESYLKS